LLKLSVSKLTLILPEGIEHVAGDMFESVPNGDAILVKVGVSHESLILYF